MRIKDLLKALHEEEDWGYVNFSHLNEVLLSVPGAPFEIRENRIRCLRRDTPDDEVESRKVPKLLYAAIRSRAYPHVHAEGIHPSSHPQVVLAEDRGMAERLGRRIDTEPVILTVNVRCARENGVVFIPSGEGLFLADRLPADCLSGPPLPKDQPAVEALRTSLKGAERRPAMPGSFVLDVAKAGAASHVPDSVKRRAEKNRGRGKHAVWTRETPPWKK